jgi:septal ring factor EnvC (AmiA/AmiB activator)
VEEKLKNRLILGLVLLCVILIFGSANSCSSSRVQEKKWRDEMSRRLDAEEKASMLQQDEGKMNDRLRKSEASLQECGKTLDSTKKALQEEQAVNQNLRGEIDKLNKLKDALEADLKEALAKIPKQQPRK